MKSLQEIVDKGKRIVFFGGAGVSTESGIPDFRGAGGIFMEEQEIPPEAVLSESFFYLHPEAFFAFYRKKLLYPEARPNAAHRKLWELERAGKLLGIVTQNIDGLHRMAGNRLVFEIHGSVHRNFCMDCGREYPMRFVLESAGIPRCECGGVVKPDVVLYGEALDPPTMRGAMRVISQADVLIVAGTSLSVSPAAEFLKNFSGRELVVINREALNLEEKATLPLRGSVAEVMGRIRVEI